MNDILEQLVNYGTHFDRAIERRPVSNSTSEPLIVSSEKGDMIVMDTSDDEVSDELSNGVGRSPWVLKALAAAALVLVVVGALYAITSDEQTTRDGTASPPETDAASESADGSANGADAVAAIEAYEDAYNAGDIEAVMELFNEDSTIVGHPFGTESDGLAAIRTLHGTDMNAAAVSDAYAFSNFAVEGNTVTWDHRWTNGADEEYCLVGNSAEVEAGVITSWTWPAPGGALCSERSAVIQKFASAYNSGDIDEVMEVFGEDSVLNGHFIAPRSVGLAAIRSTLAEDLDQSAVTDAMVVTNFEVVGNTVTWDDRATASDGVDYCRVGHSAVVEDGTITSWDWAGGGQCARRSVVIEAIVVAYNNGNLDGVLERFREDSVVVGHPFSPRSEGLDEIRLTYSEDLAAAGDTDPLTIFNLEVIGNTVTWDHRWTNSDGEQWCAEGHSAVVENGSIISWTWADTELCD